VAQVSRSTFGKYVLLRKLASGGMGEVFLAKQRRAFGLREAARHQANPLAPPRQARLPRHVLERGEAGRAPQRTHNIIQIHEMGQIDGDYFIAMEYVRGRVPARHHRRAARRGKQLPLAYVIDLAIKLCDGLGFAHQARDIRGRPMNIVHRDINPHNVLVSYAGDLKIIDFGIAKSEMTSVHTATGTIKGKFVYMSPEQSAADPDRSQERHLQPRHRDLRDGHGREPVRAPERGAVAGGHPATRRAHTVEQAPRRGAPRRDLGQGA
jgi:serine/threonine protein kinase